jgi:nucleoside-diphosphate-sugar epimerase
VIYITGATGFIGGRLARALLERGEKVRCLVRSPVRAEKLQALGVELVVGDIADEQAHRDGLRDAQLAYHLAAIYDVGIVDRAALERTNIEGTRAFLNALEQAGTPRAIYTSTTVALGPARPDDREPREAYAGPYPAHYHRTKAYAHRLARQAQQRGLPLIIVCPAFVYGPGDEGPGGRFIRDILRRRVPALLTRPGRFSYVHVDDVIAGLLAAGARGRLGETYLLTGDEASMNDFAARVARLGGTRAPVLRFPNVLARLTGTMLDVIARPTGLRFPITREAVATTATDEWLHTHERATRDLGYTHRSLDQGLPETVAAFQRRL